MSKKRIITILISTLLAVTFLFGCQKGGNTTSNDDENITSSSEESESDNEKLDDNGMPFIEGGVEIKVIDNSSISRKWLDLPYADKSESEKLDIYLPENGEGPFPTIIYVHGGAFKIGDKREGDVIEAALKGLERGYAVVSVNYRLSSEAIFPAAINDVKAAIRFVKAHAAEYKLDTNKIALWGESAGGNLVSLAGTTSDVTDFDDASLGNINISSEVKVVIDQYGLMEFTKMDEQFEELNIKPIFGKTSVATSPESQYIGGNIVDNIEKVQKTNPNNYITKNDPIFLIQHGTADENVPVTQSKLFAENLKKVLDEEKVTLDIFEGAEHGDVGEVKAFYTDENVKKVFDFLDSNLK